MPYPSVTVVLFAAIYVVGGAPCDGAQWHATGGPEGAEVLTFAQAPNGDILGGLFRDGLVRRPLGSDRWQPAGLSGIQVRFLYTASDGVIYAAAKEVGGEEASTDLGVLRSTDNGHGWQQFSEGLSERALAVNSIAETSAGVLLAATWGGLYAYSEALSSWQIFGLEGSVSSLVANPQNDLFVADHYGSRLLWSADDGETWNPRDFDEHILSVAVGDDGLVLAAADGYGGLTCVAYLSTDFGRSFSCVARVGSIDFNTAHTSLVRSTGELLLGSSKLGLSRRGGVWRSTDLGVSWQPAGLDGAEVIVLQYFPDSGYWAGTESTVYRADEDLSWQRNLDGLVKTAPLFLTATQTGLIAGGDDFGVQRWPGAGAEWQDLGLGHQRLTCGLETRDGELLVCGDYGVVFRYLGEGQWEEFWFDGPATQLVELTEGRMCRLNLSTITCASPGYENPNSCYTYFDGEGIKSIVATTDGDVVASSRQWGNSWFVLRQSSDGGCTWTETWSNPEGAGAVLATGDGGVVYAAMKVGDVWRSEDGGLTWALRGSLAGWPQAVAVDGGDRLFAATSDGGVQVSTDGGSSWRVFHEPVDGVGLQVLAIMGDELFTSFRVNGSGQGVHRTLIGPVASPVWLVADVQ